MHWHQRQRDVHVEGRKHGKVIGCKRKKRGRVSRECKQIHGNWHLVYTFWSTLASTRSNPCTFAATLQHTHDSPPALSRASTASADLRMSSALPNLACASRFWRCDLVSSAGFLGVAGLALTWGAGGATSSALGAAFGAASDAAAVSSPVAPSLSLFFLDRLRFFFAAGVAAAEVAAEADAVVGSAAAVVAGVEAAAVGVDVAVGADAALGVAASPVPLTDFFFLRTRFRLAPSVTEGVP